MDDLISRKELLNKINAYVVGSQDKEFICKLIKEMPSAQQWIPCSERLPEEYVSVLCYQPILYESNIWIGHLNADGFWVDSDGWEKLTNPATAWMPLPEPFKDKHED